MNAPETLFLYQGHLTAKRCCETIQDHEIKKLSILLPNLGKENMLKTHGVINFINDLFGENTLTIKPYNRRWSGKVTDHRRGIIDALLNHFRVHSYLNSDDYIKFIDLKEIKMNNAYGNVIYVRTNSNYQDFLRIRSQFSLNHHYPSENIAQALVSFIAKHKIESNDLFCRQLVIKNLNEVKITTDSGKKTQFIYQILRYLMEKDHFFINTLVNKGNNYTATYENLLAALSDARYFNIHEYWRIGQRHFTGDTVFFPKTKEVLIDELNTMSKLWKIIKTNRIGSGSIYKNPEEIVNYQKIF